MTYPHSYCLNCDKPARTDSDYCCLECLNEHAAEMAAADDRDPGDEA